MKKFLVLFALVISLTTGCSKENLGKGLYYADTQDGILYLELLSDNDCVMFFQGEKKYEGSYFISQGEIDLIANAVTNKGLKSASWWFGGTLGTGLINGDSFKIQAQRVYSTTPEYYYLTFYKH